jgi:hypothetical protein
MNEDLKRRIKNIQEPNADQQILELTLLLIMLRFAHNSFQALGFLWSDLDEHPKRLPRFILIATPAIRQVMDLWVSLVFMLDDFHVRSLLYEQVAYRQLREQIDKNKKRHGTDPEWTGWFEDMEAQVKLIEKHTPLTSEQKTNPTKNIHSWPHTHDLSMKPGNSQAFLQFLVEQIYGEISIEAHLKPAGLFQDAGILLTDIFPDHQKQVIEENTIHRYKGQRVFRTVITLLGIISEIEAQCNLGNREQVGKVWKRLAEHNPDAKDIYEFRYKAGFP